MKSNVIDLACELVAIPSETVLSNVAVIDYLDNWLTTREFAVERVSYTDPVGEEKFNLIAKRGDGTGGIGFFSHSDTVPYGTEAEAYQKFTQPVILGPGSIDQAHTIGEWVAVKQLEDAVGIYSNMIETFCR